MNLINFENVDIGYGKDIVLRDVNLEIDSGDVVFIQGGNGTGKTTLMKAIMQLGKDENLRVSGIMHYWLNSEKSDFEQHLKREICYAEQQEVFGDTTIGEYFSLPFLEGVRKCPFGDKKSEIEAFIWDYFQSEGIARCFEKKDKRSLLRMKIRKLSGGQKHLVSIFGEMIGLENQAKLFMFDEPLNHLDSRNAIIILNKITRLHQVRPDAAFIICSHCMSITCVNKCYRMIDEHLLEMDKSYYRCHGCFGDIDSNGIYI